MELKLCSKCHRNRRSTSFYKDSQKSDGYYSSCKDCYRERVGNKRRKHRERVSRKGIVIRWCGRCGKYKERKDFYANKASRDGMHWQCKECSIIDSRGEDSKQRQKGYRRKHRNIVLNYYGHKCVCCGESKYEFLSIDHKNGGGGKHRKKVGNGHMYRWIIINNFPSFLQVLCHNCNLAKGFYGKCPHEKNIDYEESKNP